MLFLLNGAIAWRLFRTEYHSQMWTGEGATVSYARYVRDHWPDFSWCPIWFAGLPFPNAYVPGLHLTVAGVSWLGHISAAQAFHMVVALLYSLGPVAVFWMAYRLTQTASWSFYAGLLYSLISPSAFLVSPIRKDIGGLFRDQRLHTMVGYSDNPHVSSLTLIPLAILALHVALERRKPVYHVLAALALAAVPLTNWPGAITLTFAVIAYALTMPEKNRWRRWATMAGIGALGYALAMPWMPPSTILTTQADTQQFEPANQFAGQHLVYLGILAGCTWLLLRLFAARRLPRYLRFFLLFFFFTGAVTLGHYWLHVTLLAQPHRFHLAMEMAFILSLVFGVRILLRPWPALRRPLAVAFAILCVVQFFNYRAYAHRLIQRIDIRRTSEYKTARWFEEHMRDSRVWVPGSTSFWFNAFTDTPQMTGCCDQGVLDQTVRVANYSIITDLTAENRAFENSVLWFKALGVRAVAVSGPRSTEFYKPLYHPRKFEGRLPVLWRDGDDVIYEVPEPVYTMAHALDRSDLVQRAPSHGVDTAPLIRYVAAIERPESALRIRWLDNEHAVISGNVRGGQVVNVQVTWHPGWHARVRGSLREVFADKLGFLTIAPRCSGNCAIELDYDGGKEMVAARWIQRVAIAGSFLWVGLGLIMNVNAQRKKAPQPGMVRRA